MWQPLALPPPARSDIPRGLSSSAHARGSTLPSCSMSEAALPTFPRVVGLIKVSVFCTGDCVGLSQTGFAPALGAESLSHWLEPSAQGKALWTHLPCRWLTSCLH